MPSTRRCTAALLVGALAACFAPAPLWAAQPHLLYADLKLPNGATARVNASGLATIYSRDHRSVEQRLVSLPPRARAFDGRPGAPDRLRLAAALAQAHRPYDPHTAIVVFAAGVTAPRDSFSLTAAQARALRAAAPHSAPAYTTDVATNRALASLGVDRSVRLFGDFGRSELAAMHAMTQSTAGHGVLDFSNAYLLHLTNATPRQAVRALSALRSIAYVSPNWSVATMHVAPLPLAAADANAARQRANALSDRAPFSLAATALPKNYGLTSSAQSYLNSSDIDDAAAYDEVEKTFGQLPGAGEIVTNVSIGDLDDASAAANSSDPCYDYALGYGPTTTVIGGRRYIDWPSMPLIPAYSVNAAGKLGNAEVCGNDPYLDEVGLDFSMMAPLPHAEQRSGEVGSGLDDLLGIAPGATYRLVVPGQTDPTIADIDAALLAAAAQEPHPNVITASVGFGEDQYGFPGRFLEDDPLSEAIVAAIVNSYNVVVCISANDGLRTLTKTAVPPSGGAAPTELLAPGGSPTTLADLAFSTMPSHDYDSGAIDVGGTTTDDIFANPPQYAPNANVAAQHYYPETRFTGFTSFASGFGSRVNVSAPSDNLLALEHEPGGSYDTVGVTLNGGTSGSAPETAAVAAIALQVARLTGHPFQNARAVRTFLEKTGSPVPPAAQEDEPIAVGPQIDVRNVVEQLLAKGGKSGRPAVRRIGVEQRRNYSYFDGAFESDTNPITIDMTGGDSMAWITLAPDWEFLPSTAKYRLFVKGRPNAPLAVTRTARLLPSTILAAAKLPFASASYRKVKLVYEALAGTKTIASIDVALNFGATTATSPQVLAPQVPAIVTGTSFDVSYDLTGASNVDSPMLVVSEPGRIDPYTGQIFHPTVVTALASLKGKKTIDVSSLQGGGIYGAGIEYNSTPAGVAFSDFAYFRVAPAGKAARRPAAPLLAAGGASSASATFGHDVEIPYDGSFTVKYDVSSVPKADGAMLEISAGGPGAWGIYNPFNNPNGTKKDANGVDTGSVYTKTLSGTKGTLTLNGLAAGLLPTLNHVVRVIPERGGKAAGEASEVSSITMDGILAADGGSVTHGWSVDPNGTEGFLTSSQPSASGTLLSSVDLFDQNSDKIVQTVNARDDGGFYLTYGAGTFANDLGVVGTQDVAGNVTFQYLNPIAGGTLLGEWNPGLQPGQYLLAIASNWTNETAALLTYQNDAYYASDSQLQTTTNGTAYDLSSVPAIEGMRMPSALGIAQNPATNVAIVPFQDFEAMCPAPVFVTVNLTTGALSSFTGIGNGFPDGIAIDAVHNLGVVPTDCDGGVSFYNLATDTGTEYILPNALAGISALYPVTDSVNTLALLEQTTDADFQTNNNSLSDVDVFDEQGNFVKKLERFDLFETYLPLGPQNLQIDPATRRGFLIGPNQQQIVPFAY